MATNELLTLPDGRRIGIALYGEPAGRPVVYCHGFPSSRLEAAIAHDAALRTGVRLVSLDRPGYGLSDFQAGRRISDWPADAAHAADALKIDRFGVLGVSGGAPYALACAAALGSRVTAVGLVAGLSVEHAQDCSDFHPFARASLRLARVFPRISQAINGPLGIMLRDRPSWMLRLLGATLPAPDREALSDPRHFGKLAASLGEAFRQGGRAAAYDLTLLARAGGVDPRRIEAPVYVWHGEADTTVPVAVGRRNAERLTGCRADFLSEEGHYSLPIRHMDAILRKLASHA